MRIRSRILALSQLPPAVLNGPQRVQRAQVVFFDVNRAIGSLGQRFANGLLRPRGAQTQHYYLAAVFFLELKRFFQGVRIGLVDLETQVGFFNPAGPRGYAATRSCESRMGTCLIATIIFMDDRGPTMLVRPS